MSESINIWQLASEIKFWIAAAAENVKAHLHDDLQVETKSNRNDLVTNVDKLTEKHLVGEIRRAYPKARIVGEEGFGDQVDDLAGLVFFVDPIDRNDEFRQGKRKLCHYDWGLLRWHWSRRCDYGRCGGQHFLGRARTWGL